MQCFLAMFLGNIVVGMLLKAKGKHYPGFSNIKRQKYDNVATKFCATKVICMQVGNLQ